MQNSCEKLAGGWLASQRESWLATGESWPGWRKLKAGLAWRNVNISWLGGGS